MFEMGTRGSPPPSLPNGVRLSVMLAQKGTVHIQGYSLKTRNEVNAVKHPGNTFASSTALRGLVACKASSSAVNFRWKVRRVSPRPISIRQLHTLLRFHLRPIYLVVYKGSYLLGNLILRGASRLDAFSAYPVRSWLPSYAPGGTTGTPAERPSRSSRTKDSSSQISCAHDR